MTKRTTTLLALAAVASVIWTGSSLACPVCYGSPDSPTTSGVAAAILSLLGVTGGVLAAFASMFLRIRRRTRALDAHGHNL
jgi:hypothetical protein